MPETEPGPLQRFRLDGRVILVTGSTGHLGEPISRAIAAVGGVPVLAGRNSERLTELAGHIAGSGGRADCEAFDIGDATACRAAIDAIAQRHGRLDGIVNNAYGGRSVTLENTLEADFELAARQNLIGPFALIQHALPLLRKAGDRHLGGASVVNMASMYGHVSPDPRIYGTSGKNNPPHYGAAKAGLLQLTRYLAAHLGPERIRVNSISPGPFPPASIVDTAPEFHKELCSKAPMGRIGSASELVGPMLFLLSDAASYVNGADLPVDGGWTAW